MLGDLGLMGNNRCVRMSLSFLVAAFVGGCSAGPRAQVAGPVERNEAVPYGYVSLGGARAECRTRPAFGELNGVPATSLVCSRELLERVLESQARAKGATVLARLRCARAGDSGIRCSATLARPQDPVITVGSPGPEPSDAGVVSSA